MKDVEDPFEFLKGCDVFEEYIAVRTGMSTRSKDEQEKIEFYISGRCLREPEFLKEVRKINSLILDSSK